MAKGGPCAIWAMRDGDYEAHVFEGNQGGLTAALAYVGSNGVVHVYPGNTAITIPTIAAGVRLTTHESGVEATYGPATTEYTRTGRRKNTHYNAADYDTVADAIAAVPIGGRLYFPNDAGPYTPADANGWTLNKPIEIYGDGLTYEEDTGFVYYQSGGSWANSKMFTFADSVLTRDIYIHDCMFSSGAGASSTTGTGDVFYYGGTAVISDIMFERVNILHAGGNGLNFDTQGAGFVVGFRMKDCTVSTARKNGLFLRNGTLVVLDRTSYSQNRLAQAALEACGSGVAITGSNFENGGADQSTAYHGHLYLGSCFGVLISGNNFEEFNLNTVKNAIALENSHGCIVQGNEFNNSTSVADSRAAYIVSASSNNIIGGNIISQVHKVVEMAIAPGAGNVVMPNRVHVSDATAPGVVEMPTGGRNFALLNDQPSGLGGNVGAGLLLPSVPDHTALHSTIVQDGLLVYDSGTDKLMLRANGAWVVVGTQT